MPPASDPSAHRVLSSFLALLATIDGGADFWNDLSGEGQVIYAGDVAQLAHSTARVCVVVGCDPLECSYAEELGAMAYTLPLRIVGVALAEHDTPLDRWIAGARLQRDILTLVAANQGIASALNTLGVQTKADVSAYEGDAFGDGVQRATVAGTITIKWMESV